MRLNILESVDLKAVFIGIASSILSFLTVYGLYLKYGKEKVYVVDIQTLVSKGCRVDRIIDVVSKKKGIVFDSVMIIYASDAIDITKEVGIDAGCM